MKRSYLSVSKCAALVAMSAAATLSAACSSAPRGAAGEPIRIDGSSTVYPITAAVAENFKKENPAAKVDVAFSVKSESKEDSKLSITVTQTKNRDGATFTAPTR